MKAVEMRGGPHRRQTSLSSSMGVEFVKTAAAREAGPAAEGRGPRGAAGKGGACGLGLREGRVALTGTHGMGHPGPQVSPRGGAGVMPGGEAASDGLGF